MGHFDFFNAIKNDNDPAGETIHLRMERGVLKRVRGKITALRYIDADTKHHVMYVPSLELSGYGITIEEAEDMLKSSLDDFWQHLSSLTSGKIDTELSSLGWEKGIFNKKFSHAYVDVQGQLQNLNAQDNKVQRLTLTSA